MQFVPQLLLNLKCTLVHRKLPHRQSIVTGLREDRSRDTSEWVEIIFKKTDMPVTCEGALSSPVIHLRIQFSNAKNVLSAKFHLQICDMFRERIMRSLKAKKWVRNFNKWKMYCEKIMRGSKAWKWMRNFNEWNSETFAHLPVQISSCLIFTSFLNLKASFVFH